MDSVFKEMTKYMGIPFDEVLDFKYSVISNSVVNVTGYKKLISYSTDIVSLGVKNNELCIEGHDLKIKELDKSNIVITGKVNKVYLLKEI